jgi:hypothetical protein
VNDNTFIVGTSHCIIVYNTSNHTHVSYLHDSISEKYYHLNDQEIIITQVTKIVRFNFITGYILPLCSSILDIHWVIRLKDILIVGEGFGMKISNSVSFEVMHRIILGRRIITGVNLHENLLVCFEEGDTSLKMKLMFITEEVPFGFTFRDVHQFIIEPSILLINNEIFLTQIMLF